MTKQHKENLLRDPVVREEYLAHCVGVAQAVFDDGWDAGRYHAHCLGVSVSDRGCVDAGRASFGSLASWRGKQEAWLKATMDGEVVLSDKDYIMRFDVVESSGKLRPLTVGSANMQVLLPLHKTLYDHLSSFPWLLRGSPSAARLLEALGPLGEGEEFLSVDFESATDNLSVEVAHAILSAAREKCHVVPEGIWEVACRSLRPFVDYEGQGKLDSSYQLRRGQMMGSLLSFPVLCLQTYAFWLWCSGKKFQAGARGRDRGWQFRQVREGGCLVNGDDLLSRVVSPRSFFEGAAETGSVVNKKKTQSSKSFLNINSTPFFWCSERQLFFPLDFVRPRSLVFDSPCSFNLVRSTTENLLVDSFRRGVFDLMMTICARQVTEVGRSFFFCGARGAKQASWVERNELPYEEFFIDRHEAPLPVQPSKLKEATTEVPARFRGSQTIGDVSRMWTSMSRMKGGDLGSRAKWDQTKELRKARFDVREARRLEAGRKGRDLWKREGVRRLPEGKGGLKAPMDRRVVFLEGAMGTRVELLSRKQARTEAVRRIRGRKEETKETMPAGLLRVVEFVEGVRRGDDLTAEELAVVSDGAPFSVGLLSGEVAELISEGAAAVRRRVEFVEAAGVRVA